MSTVADREPRLRRIAWTATWIAALVDAVILVAVWAGFFWRRYALEGGQGTSVSELKLLGANAALQQRSYSSPIGWTSAAAAAIIFGTSELPIKIPRSQDIGPAFFNAYTYLGNGLCHSLFLLALPSSNKPFEWQWEAVGAALNIILVQAFARSAIWLLGISVAPPMWCVVGMLTSFAWGTLAFGDRPGSMILSLTGLLLLMVGVTCVSGASVLSHRYLLQVGKEDVVVPSADGAAINHAPDTAEDIALTSVVGRSLVEYDDGVYVDNGPKPSIPPPRTKGEDEQPLSNSLVRGFIYALGAGIADGSLVAFYQEAERKRERLLVNERQSSQAIFDYFGTFGITMLAIASVLIAGLHIMNKLSKATNVRNTIECTLETKLPGIISGFMWAGANTCSVLSSHFLGMSLSFPLTQTASVICALLGLFVFGELQGAKARGLFSMALFLIVIGALCLAVFGRPVAPST